MLQRRVEIQQKGYWTTPGSRGHGVASEALAALTDRTSEVLDTDGLQYIELLRQVGNRSSCRVAEKYGYGLTGYHRPRPWIF